MNNKALNPKEKKVLKALNTKSFKVMTPNQKEAILRVAAKDFSIKFTPVFKKLANE